MRLLKIKNKLKVGCFLQIKSERILDVSWVFLIKQLALALVVWIWDDYSQLRLVGYLLPHPTRTHGIMVKYDMHLSLLLNSRVNDSV